MAHPTRTPGSTRSMFTPDIYSPAERALLLRHVVKMANGKLEKSGNFRTTEDDVRKIFTIHLPNALKIARKSGRPLRILFWAHGGLVPEEDALRHVLDYSQTWINAGIYPIYFVWKTGLLDALGSLTSGGTRGGWFAETITDPMLEAATRIPACAVWNEMKSFAEAASTNIGGATFALNRFAEFRKQHANETECFACGHSAGSIFHSYFLPLLAANGISVRELFLLAPAATISLFNEKLASLIGPSKPIRRCSMFTMTEEAERADQCLHIYRKSLLYFVSRACEFNHEEPILGMVECLRTSLRSRAFWGLDTDRPASAELILSPSRTYDGTRSTNSTSHGDFDDDPDTLNSLARRITGDTSIAPFNVNNTSRSIASRGIDDSISGPSICAAPKPDLKGVTIHLRQGSIDRIEGNPAIGYRAAGHYEGAEPMGPEWTLDEWVSGGSETGERIIVGMTRRGTMAGGLGQTTLIPHPSNQCAAILGLGRLGSLGPAELTTAVCELCVEISQIKGKSRHLASVLIGGGAGNMSIDSAVNAWLRGIAQARAAGAVSLRNVTFVELDCERYLHIEAALARSVGNVTNATLDIDAAEYVKVLAQAKKDAVEKASDRIDELKRRRKERLRGGVQRPNATHWEPCHLNIRATAQSCHFTAMTKDAAVPERTTQTDPRIIAEISSMIAATADPETLREWGKTLQQLIIPRDLHSLLFSSATPVVLTLDASMARIPWEMLTLPNVISPDIDIPTVHARSFLGLAENYGVTRQLQTSFAPMPEREKKRTTELSVLIVGDPAPDASLRGAHREALWLRDFLNGDAVQREFEKVTIKFLDGPNATRANLARELCNRSYDILHFAGHCYYNNDAPAKSGWVFRASPLEVFTADELMRLDRVPSFIFSNACESGITPDRAREANLDLSPAFAEAFFAKGVGNLICTGWPVNDRAALAFTEEFYTSTLINGLSIREAAQNARRKAADLSFQTAGAYQHYGSPSARIIPPTPAKANTRTASRNPRTIS